jgi:hypothetical protein
MSLGEQPVLLVELERDLRDLGEPVGGWAAELHRRGVAVVVDDLDRPAVDRSSARAIYAEARTRREAAARKREVAEAAAIEKDREFRSTLPVGIPAGAVPEGVSAAQWAMLNDPDRGKQRRESVLDHALAHRDGAVFHPIGGES